MINHRILFFLTLFQASLCQFVQVRTAEELIVLFNEKTEGILKKDIELLDDLDFTSSNLIFPLGISSSGICTVYSGVFRGNGHSINNLKMNVKNNAIFSKAGLFCSLKDATVENLLINKSCSFNGNTAGALSVRAVGSIIVTNVTNRVLPVESVGLEAS